MNCPDARQDLHEWMDGELAAASSVQQHLVDCPECAAYHRDMETIREALAGARQKLPQPLSSQLARQLEARRHRGSLLARLIHRVWDWPAAIDTRLLCARLGALPLTLLLFGLISVQVYPVRVQPWTYSVVKSTPGSATFSRTTAPVMVRVMQRNEEINNLMDAAWRIPFEDSLSVLADIQPNGGATIENILELPKSPLLLQAVDDTLRHSTFDERADSFVIYNFQKVDVFAGL